MRFSEPSSGGERQPIRGATKIHKALSIAHLTTVHPRNDTRIFRKMCRSLAALGHAVTLYVADGLGDDTRDGVKIVDIGLPIGRLKRVLLSTTTMWIRALRGGHDLLHFHDPELILGALFSKLNGQTVVYDIHEYYRLHFLGIASLPAICRQALARAYGFAERIAAIWLDGCVVVSPLMLRRLPCRHAAVVANYVRAEEFEPGQIPFAERERQVCYVGVISKERCIEAMADALSMVPGRIVLAGKWYPRSWRAEMTSRPGWSAVEELGMIDRTRMQHEFEQSQAGLLILDLHGDEQHSSSNKLFEYMAAGLPVIASDLQFAREVISQFHCGLLVTPAADPTAIAAAITWIFEHPQDAERMGQAGRHAIEVAYNWENALKELLELYASVA